MTGTERSELIAIIVSTFLLPKENRRLLSGILEGADLQKELWNKAESLLPDQVILDFSRIPMIYESICISFPPKEVPDYFFCTVLMLYQPKKLFLDVNSKRGLMESLISLRYDDGLKSRFIISESIEKAKKSIQQLSFLRRVANISKNIYDSFNYLDNENAEFDKHEYPV